MPEVIQLKGAEPEGTPGCLLSQSPEDTDRIQDRRRREKEGERERKEGKKKEGRDRRVGGAGKTELEELFPQGILNWKLLARAKIKN